jgi:hypothetical protein
VTLEGIHEKIKSKSTNFSQETIQPKNLEEQVEPHHIKQTIGINEKSYN